MSRGLFCEECADGDREVRTEKASACGHDAAHPGMRWCFICAAGRGECMACGSSLPERG